MSRRTAPIPAPHAQPFQAGIQHPDLWLWDSWTLQGAEGDLHLYCLALSRTGFDGSSILPCQRNDHSFHIRHFISDDEGASWRDAGMAIAPGNAEDGADTHNVWSGSVLAGRDGQILFAYTGIREVSAERPFLQTICIGRGTAPDAMTHAPPAAISCPARDYDQITELGFYVGPRDRLGDRAGEEGGPIMAWRDPFLVRDHDGELNAFWAAKIGPTAPAMARARLAETPEGVALAELLPPIELPHASEYTQSEVPKLSFDKGTQRWLLLISASDRMYEAQPDAEVRQHQRLYASDTLDGPWSPALASGSLLTGLDYMFGSSLVGHDMSRGMLSLLGPYTEQAAPEKQLSFPMVRNLDVTPAFRPA
ncbi:hypothetical protein [uncultured Hyphomonas sp.]|jgi:hypothetical protein|uniref:hypothetical protein n=1 Tax=uncultured Hyphomonas sp. TaxID=225298 RepID=UPI000C61E360|nr:hypothetical protein [Hyphomonadaceae bacterium]MBA29523.1 hypothetical protein [Hyphomonadaceae bacterium]|tara:strand:+ start:465884 stop:466978 length:1095 start_codon:yes stop_codon:yes gene_type:complete